MQTARFEAKTTVEGPGERSALWLQGCSIGCEGCCNPELQPRQGGLEMTVAEIAAKVIAAAADGLTLLGGEPLDQATELFELLQLLRVAGYHGIIMFTGYEWNEIIATPEKQRVAELCDLVIAGPFERQRSPGGRRWIGSDNQTLHFITPFYDELRRSWPKFVREIEIFIRDGVIMVNGTPLGPEHELSCRPTEHKKGKT
ncbi:MAG TPA: 4Fe-4S single cluster domain-containing protein [Candidatus Rifleibacterium sp.]|nr:4Fe-4S single cluster domain-containing protein [Candidatus Rifleibacterium sp.]HPT44777.1 4Fe-4S single cluster domain-containing protein [Candidatus Rifleibacterium sp.]